MCIVVYTAKTCTVIIMHGKETCRDVLHNASINCMMHALGHVYIVDIVIFCQSLLHLFKIIALRVLLAGFNLLGGVEGKILHQTLQLPPKKLQMNY